MVDAPSTRDIDDALSVLPAGPDGAPRLLVSIADVGEHVAEGSAQDVEARERLCTLPPPQQGPHPSYAPVMKQHRRGQLINVSSSGGHAVSPTAAVYCATQYAVMAISEGLRQEVGGDIRVTVISPGVTESELAESITDPLAQQGMKDFRRIAIPADAIARAIAFSVEQPDDVDVSEIIVRPTDIPY